MANTTDLLLKKFLSSDALSGISKASGVGSEDVSKILSSALPSLLKGASGQSTDKKVSSGFAQALMSHSKKDTNDLGSFFDSVDLADGKKVVAHLTGDADKTADMVAKDAGVTKGAASSVLSAAAPLLMSLLGKQSNAEDSDESGILSAVGNILGGDLGSIAKAAIAAYAVTKLKETVTGKSSKKKTSSKKTSTTSSKKKKTSGVDLSDGLDVGDVIGLVGNMIKK